jgi:hypothetical protein
MANDLPQVRPGDVISSDLINLIITKLQALEQTIGSGGTNVAISGFDPPNQQAAGQILTVKGLNFLFPPTNNRVTVGDIVINDFRPDSNTTQLKFVLPQSIPVAPGGQNVPIRVENSQGSDQKLYRLMPAIPVAGPPPQITSITLQTAAGSTTLQIGKIAFIAGQNFAATATDNIISFTVQTGSGSAVYPKQGSSLVFDPATNTSQILVTVPDITEIVSGAGPSFVTLQVGVGAQVPAVKVVPIIRP